MQLFGDFCVMSDGWDQGWKRVNAAGRAKKHWTIIEYLLLNRDRVVTSEELMETFWAEEEIGDPLASLRSGMMRCRAALAELGLPDAKELILTASGGYIWNPDRPTEVDCETFERLLRRAQAHPERPESTDELLEAARLYRGDLWLGGRSGAKLASRATWYRGLYAEAVQEAAEKLWDAQRWTDVVSVCEPAVRMAPENESLSVFFIRALTALHQQEKALEYYEYIVKKLADDYGHTPSKELELAGNEAALRRTAGRAEYETVVEFLCAREPMTGAFYCDYMTFRNIALLQARASERAHEPAQLVILSVTGVGEDGRPFAASTDMKRLERVLTGSLRGGDPFTRLSATQYLVLLPGSTAENTDVVLNRVESRFRHDFPRSRARIRGRVFPIDILLPAEEP